MGERSVSRWPLGKSSGTVQSTTALAIPDKYSIMYPGLCGMKFKAVSKYPSKVKTTSHHSVPVSNLNSYYDMCLGLIAEQMRIMMNSMFLVCGIKLINNKLLFVIQ